MAHYLTIAAIWLLADCILAPFAGRFIRVGMGDGEQLAALAPDEKKAAVS